MLAQSASAELEQVQRNRLLQYLSDIGITEAVELQVETLREDYARIYTDLPPNFWKDDRVVGLFESYSASTLDSYVVVMEQEFSPEEIDFLVQFYRTADGRRAVQLGKRMTPAFVAVSSDISMEFSEALVQLIDEVAQEAQDGTPGDVEQTT